VFILLPEYFLLLEVLEHTTKYIILRFQNGVKLGLKSFIWKILLFVLIVNLEEFIHLLGGFVLLAKRGVQWVYLVLE
jgi:hypothetical protein